MKEALATKNATRAATAIATCLRGLRGQSVFVAIVASDVVA
jgi:hypothetical protein